jgi:ATP-dependent Lon protease
MIDQKIIENFPGLIVRKDLTKTLKGNAIVPSYVLEYLLGQYCATDDSESIESGIETVKNILAKHYVNRNESGLIKSTIKEKGRHKVIDKVSVELNEKSGTYEASFSNLGIKKVQTDSDYIKKHPKLLVGGVWSIVDIEYDPVDDPKASPWNIDTLKPIQVSHADLNEFKAARANFTTDEWIDALVQSIGFNPEMLGRRQKLLQLVRLVPFCERNYNYIELGPKGTGKSHIFSEFSPHGMIVSGGEVTVAKLFVNNASGKIGLVGYWDSVAFDEFAGKDKKVDKNMVDIMKNYMANKSFSRGVEMLGAEASMSFLGNTRKSVAYMLKHSHFFDDLPDKYIDSAFLDRLHFYSPGWETSIIRSELFADGFGFIVDYLAEVMKKLRNFDESHAYSKYFKLDSEISTRDRDGIHKTFSGLMKVIYPHGECTKEEAEEILAFAVEGRKRVKDHLMRIDSTFNPVEFAYLNLESGKKVDVKTLEEIRHPNLTGPGVQGAEDSVSDAEPVEVTPSATETPAAPEEPKLEAGKHLTIPENASGISFAGLFADYLKGATEIIVHDPYVRLFWQLKNMMEFLEMVHQLVPEGDQIEVKLVTKSDTERCVEQDEGLRKMEESFVGSKVSFSFEYDNSDSFHARSISTDTEWKITLDRGLDIFQRYDMSPFSLAGKVQEERQCKAFEVTYLRS